MLTEDQKKQIDHVVAKIRHVEAITFEDTPNFAVTPEGLDYMKESFKKHEQSFSLLEGKLVCSCGVKLRSMTPEEWGNM